MYFFDRTESAAFASGQGLGGDFSDMEKHPESYERYYPMVRVKADDRGLNRLIMALVLNDALYESAEEWSREYE